MTRRRNPYGDQGGRPDPFALLFLVAVAVLGSMLFCGILRSCQGPGAALHQVAR